MILADKIIKLRKKYGWSQEELADKMNVSRQSVSKWEGALSIPDLNKIIKLAEIFGVSTDYLLKDNIEQVEINSSDQEDGITVVTLQEAQDYVNLSYDHSKVVVKAVMILIYSVLPLLFLLALSNGKAPLFTDKIATGVGITLLFLMVASGVIILISTSHISKKLETFKSKVFELEYGVDSIFREKLDAYGPKYYKMLAIAVTMFVFSPVPLILSGIFDTSDMTRLFMVVLMIGLIGIGVALIVPASDRYNAYNLLLGEGEYDPVKREKNKRIERFGAFYWPLVTAIYIGWSLWTMAWGITWIVWPVAGILFSSFVGLIHFLKSNET